MGEIDVLFARSDSIYHQMRGLDVYDIERDALTCPGGRPAICHPPCRAWGKFAWRAKPRPGEKELAPWAVEHIRKNGGVLEHPQGSALWKYCQLPAPGLVDEFGGWTLAVDQWNFGHAARKATLLYIVGCPMGEVPPIPMRAGAPKFGIGDCSLPEISKADRERTPPEFARFLCAIARRCAEYPYHVMHYR